MAAKRRTPTYADIEALPEHFIGEILDGELLVSRLPSVLFTAVASAMLPTIGGTFSSSWWFLWRPELHLGADVVVPDLAGWRRERMPRIPNVVGITMPPDWVCEVISPSTARHDRVAKMRIYARSGVPWVWHLDPLAHTLQVFQLDGKRYAVASEHDGEAEPLARARPFDAVELDMARSWEGIETAPTPVPHATPRKRDKATPEPKRAQAARRRARAK